MRIVRPSRTGSDSRSTTSASVANSTTKDSANFAGLSHTLAPWKVRVSIAPAAAKPASSAIAKPVSAHSVRGAVTVAHEGMAVAGMAWSGVEGAQYPRGVTPAAPVAVLLSRLMAQALATC